MKILKLLLFPQDLWHCVALSITICWFCYLFYSGTAFLITLRAKLYLSVVLVYITLMDNDLIISSFDYWLSIFLDK